MGVNYSTRESDFVVFSPPNHAKGLPERGENRPRFGDFYIYVGCGSYELKCSVKFEYPSWNDNIQEHVVQGKVVCVVVILFPLGEVVSPVFVSGGWGWIELASC